MTNIGKGQFIAGSWVAGEGDTLVSSNPASNEQLWSSNSASPAQVTAAVASARDAFRSWMLVPFAERLEVIESFLRQLEAKQQDFVAAIAQETGKPYWESATEVGAMLGKLATSLAAYQERTGVKESTSNGVDCVTRHRPHGVIGVLGPFNFPGHLPNGHIIPALLAGNTIVFKPSEQTPLVGEQMVSFWQRAGLPAGVLNLVQGGAQVGQALATADDLDGLFFTGSYTTGHRLQQHFAGYSDKILALEMGGNNPLIVINVSDITASCYHTIQSAFITAGQRCTCARRLIVPQGAAGDDFLQRLLELTKKIAVGANTTQPEPFMGSMISAQQATAILQAQHDLQQAGGDSLLEMSLLTANTGLVSPGLIDVSAVAKRKDEELFGPLLQIIRVKDFAQAVVEANNTGYGLSAGIFTDDEELYRSFYDSSRAGIVNWNRPLTGANSSAPFGGTGKSGNYRPSAYYAADYCAYPVASMEAATMCMPKDLLPGLNF